MDHRRACRILGVAPGASLEEARAAYLDLARVWHPDRFGHDERLRRKADANLQRINDAWAFLSRAGPAPATALSRLSSTFASVLGLGDLRDSTACAAVGAAEGARQASAGPAGAAGPAGPVGPVGTSRRSVWVLGLGLARAARSRRRRARGRRWVLPALLALAAGLVLWLVLR